ncbi:MAG: Rieske 2Fe-2S domain-containing protein [Hyphomicrobiales bacterium]
MSSLRTRAFEVAAAVIGAAAAVLGAGAAGLVLAVRGFHRRPRAHAASGEPPREDTRPPVPPTPADSESDAEISRRRFLVLLSAGLTAVGTAVVAVPVVGFLVGPLVKKTPDVWRRVGPVGEFGVGETREVTFDDPSPLPWAGVTARSGAYVRRTGDNQFVAFSIHCTHLGCAIRWIPSASLFMCPCHGGVFYADGTVAAGPPPIPLARYDVRVVDGEVEIETRPLPITGGTLPGAQERE